MTVRACSFAGLFFLCGCLDGGADEEDLGLFGRLDYTISDGRSGFVDFPSSGGSILGDPGSRSTLLRMDSDGDSLAFAVDGVIEQGTYTIGAEHTSTISFSGADGFIGTIATGELLIDRVESLGSDSPVIADELLVEGSFDLEFGLNESPPSTLEATGSFRGRVLDSSL